jgi:acetyl esterase/lipase
MDLCLKKSFNREMKSVLSCLVALSMFSLSLAAAEIEADSARSGRMEIKLWPHGSPGDTAMLGPEKDMTKDSDGNVGGRRVIRLGNVTDPTITVYPAEASKATGAAVLVCPGGAYNILALDLEGTEVCERLNRMGVTAVLLKYRVPKRPGLEKHVPALQDAERAAGLIRQHAGEWGIDSKRVGVLGFSAGGHLAAVLSNQSAQRNYPKVDAADDLNFRPDFTVLIYPAYLTLEKDGSKLAPEVTVSHDSPQAFIAMTEDDPVRVENALTYAAALKKEKVSFELHIYPTGGHGYGLRKTAQSVTTWPDRLEEWLAARGLNHK